MSAEDIFRCAQVESAMDNIAQGVSAYYDALIEAGVPQILAEQLTRDYCWQLWNSTLTDKKHD